jgi:hypothetical protein
MNSSKAKQAKSKAKARTKQKTADSAQQAAQMAALQQQQMAAQELTPEIQAHQIAMQDRTSTVYPYHRIGPMPNNYYNPGNVIGGGYGPQG